MITDAELKSVITDLHDAGLDWKEIAKKVKQPLGRVFALYNGEAEEVATNDLSDRNAQIIERYQAGEDGVQLAADFGVSDSTIYKVLKDNGIDRRKHTLPAASTRDKAEDQAVVDAYLIDKLTHKQIAEKLHRSPKTISRILHEHGVEMRKPHGPAAKQKKTAPKVKVPVTQKREIEKPTLQIRVTYTVMVEEMFETDAELADHLTTIDLHKAVGLTITRK